MLYILHWVEDVTRLVHASEEGAELRDRTQEMEREVVARSFAPLDVSTFTLELAGMFQSAFEKAGLRFVVDCRALSGPVWVGGHGA